MHVSRVFLKPIPVADIALDWTMKWDGSGSRMPLHILRYYTKHLPEEVKEMQENFWPG
jgi:hypothetical protein